MGFPEFLGVDSRWSALPTMQQPPWFLQAIGAVGPEGMQGHLLVRQPGGAEFQLFMVPSLQGWR